jgi:hypothetical protein
MNLLRSLSNRLANNNNHDNNNTTNNDRNYDNNTTNNDNHDNNTSNNDNNTKLISQEITEPLDLLFIDADSKDPSLGMSAPPQTFITTEALLTFHSVIKPGGVLALNVVARSKHLLFELIDNIASVWCIDSDNIDIDSSRCNNTSNKDINSNKDSSSIVNSLGGKIYMIKASEDTVNVILMIVKGINLSIS